MQCLENLVVRSASEGLWGERMLTFPPWFSRTAVSAVQARIDTYAQAARYPRRGLCHAAGGPPLCQTAIAELQAGDFIGLVVDDPRTRTEINGFVFIMNVAYNLHRNRPPVKRLTCLQTGIAVVRNPVIFAVNNIPLAVNDVVLGVNG